MTENLVIVESPAKAKTIKKYLGMEFEVLASYGHVRDLVPKEGAVDPAHHFAMKYQIVERNQKHVDAISRALKKAKALFLATDPDREGEAISWHLYELLKAQGELEGKEVQRVVFYEITKNSVNEAMAAPRELSVDLVNAQQARRALDFLVGFNLSPLLWKKVRPGLSAGRVQSPALRMICEREDEIAAFVAREYWSIDAELDYAEQKFPGKLVEYRGAKVEQFSFTTESQARNVERTLLDEAGGELGVLTVDRKQRKRNPAPPFTTSTLQQEAARKLGFSAQKTMRVAQQLYEGVDIGEGSVGLITYMRTDSVSLAAEAVQEMREVIAKLYGPEAVAGEVRVYKTKSKSAQEAHEAIRPTSASIIPADIERHLEADQFKLYSLIWKRAVACQMAHALFDTVAVDILAGADGPQRHVLRANGSTLVKPGYIAVYQEGVDDTVQDDSDHVLPPLSEADRVALQSVNPAQHFTEPPPRFSEASLVKALEEYGIGRPSTYASIISTLVNREYVTLDKKRFQPTDVGRVVNKFLTDHFAHWVDYEFTAKLEDELDDISNGKEEWKPVLARFWKDFSAQITEKESVSRKEVTQEVLEEICPKCGKHQLTNRLGRRGRFIGCAGYPECDYTRNVDGAESQEAQKREIGTDPATHQLIQLLVGPYGPYVQLGEPEGDKKPKRVSVPKNVPPDSVDLKVALQLLALPRDLGAHPEGGKKVNAAIGRFGPYVSHDGLFKSIPKDESVFDITLERAVALLKEPKQFSARGALKVLGKHPDDNQPVALYSGRYGAYVKHGKVNATLTDQGAVGTITLAEALELLAAKSGKKPKAGPKGAKTGKAKMKKAA